MAAVDARPGEIAMASTMTSKVLARAAGLSSAPPGTALVARVELVTCLDGTTFIDSFRAEELPVWDPTRIVFCFDHVFQPEWFPQRSDREHPKIRAFARERGIPDENVYDFGRNGISHQIPVEQGMALPGTICIGADTQSATMGAANCLALPALWGIDPIVMTGEMWMIVPDCVRLVLSGRLSEGVSGKDVVYRLIGALRTVAAGRVIEIAGDGVATLPIDVRMAIANGAVQIGALTVVFPFDETLGRYLSGRARRAFEPVAADEDAPYAATMELDLASLIPLVAGPHDVEAIRPVREVAGLPVTAAYIGSCAAGRLDDLRAAARVLSGRRVAPGVRLIVTPVSAETYRDAAREGLLELFADAGATVTQPGCGACYSGNLSPLKLAAGERCISTSVEALRGRMGAQDSEILLANASVVAASAIAGRIVEGGAPGDFAS